MPFPVSLDLSPSNLSLDITYLEKLLWHISFSIFSPTTSVWVRNLSYKLWFRENRTPFLLRGVIFHKGQAFPGVSLERAFLQAPGPQCTERGLSACWGTYSLAHLGKYPLEHRTWLKSHKFWLPSSSDHSLKLIGILLIYFVRKIFKRPLCSWMVALHSLPHYNFLNIS